MKTRISLSIFSIFLLLFLLACAPSVSVRTQRGTEPRTPRPVSYQLLVYESQHQLPSIAEVFGTVSAGDAGLTTDCSLRTMVDVVISKARAVGADAIQIARVNPPDFWSTCYRVSARLIAFNLDDWETIEKSEEELVRYFDENLTKLDPIEGIWTSQNNQYQVGIFKDQQNDDRDYVAIVLRSEHPLWSKQQVKMEFEKTVQGTVYSTSYYMGDHSRQGTTATINGSGQLEMLLRKLDGSPFPTTFLKTYPDNIGSFAPDSTEPPSSTTVSTGSGFLISKSGLIVTNFHVVDNAQELTVLLPEDDTVYSAEVVLKDINNDLAVLQLKNFKYDDAFVRDIPFSIAPSSSVQVGQKVFTIGYPLGAVLGTTARLSNGIVNSLYGLRDDPRLFQISNPIQPGNSGGPLFNRDGELIGIVVATLNAQFFLEEADFVPQNVNFAIKSDYLINLLSLLPEVQLSDETNFLSGKTLEEQVSILTPFVVSIIGQ